MLGCAAGVVVSTAVSICLNFVVTPLYAGATYEMVAAMVLPALLPFNALKALANSVIAIVSYRKLAALLEGRKVTIYHPSEKALDRAGESPRIGTYP